MTLEVILREIEKRNNFHCQLQKFLLKLKNKQNIYNNEEVGCGIS